MTEIMGEFYWCFLLVLSCIYPIILVVFGYMSGSLNPGSSILTCSVVLSYKYIVITVLNVNRCSTNSGHSRALLSAFSASPKKRCGIWRK